MLYDICILSKNIFQKYLRIVLTLIYASLLPGYAMLIGYSLLLRPGEVGYQTRSDERNLYNKNNNNI